MTILAMKEEPEGLVIEAISEDGQGRVAFPPTSKENLANLARDILRKVEDPLYSDAIKLIDAAYAMGCEETAEAAGEPNDDR